MPFDVKMPKKRRARKKETVPRQQPEAELRKQVVRYLRTRGKCYRIENGITGKNNTGLADLLFFWSGGMVWIELKSNEGTLQDNQIEFQELCKKAHINHWVIRSIDELERMLTIW